VTHGPPLDGPAWLDLSMIHPRCSPFVAAASHLRGATAALCDRRRGASTGHMRAICTPVTSLCLPASRRTHGHLGKLVTQYIRILGDAVPQRSLVVTRSPFLLVPTGNRAWHFCRVRVMCAASARCCSPKLQGDRCGLGRTLPSLIESSVVASMPINAITQCAGWAHAEQQLQKKQSDNAEIAIFQACHCGRTYLTDTVQHTSLTSRRRNLIRSHNK
jgi:hypothetical protein